MFNILIGDAYRPGVSIRIWAIAEVINEGYNFDKMKIIFFDMPENHDN